MKTITFYSYKGGVGRSLALSNIAKRLAEFDKKVCIIDFDLEAPGIDHKFSEYIKGNSVKKGIVDYIYSFLNEKILPDNIKDFITPIDFENKKLRNIDLLAAGNTSSQQYWRKLAMIYWGSMFYDKNSQGVSFFLDLKAKIEKELSPDFLLIDSRTGITDISGITMSILADEIVLFCANNRENKTGITQIINTISNPSNNFKNVAPKFHVILSRIPFIEKASEKYKEQNAKMILLNEINLNLRSHKRNLLEKVLVLHSDPELEYEEKFKIGYDDNSLKVKGTPLSIDYLELFEEITKDVLTESDKVRFNSIRKSEILIEEAKSKEDSFTKVKLLKSAIEINPNSDDAYYELAVVYLLKGEYQLAVDEIQKSLDINSAQTSKIILGMALGRMKEKSNIDKAINIFIDILKSDDNNWSALYELGHIYESGKNYDLALIYLNKLVEFYPDDKAYNSIANLYKKKGDYQLALDFIYKSLEINPQSTYSTGTLAEIQAYLNNEKEFYKNLELFFSFGDKNLDFKKIILDDDIYKKYLKEERFINILEKYNFDIDPDILDNI